MMKMLTKRMKTIMNVIMIFADNNFVEDGDSFVVDGKEDGDHKIFVKDTVAE